MPEADNWRIGKGKTPEDATLLTESLSQPFSDLVRAFMKRSDNLYGEAFLKTIGGGTSRGGVREVQALLRRWNVPTAGLAMVDGSGLSSLNAVTPHLLTELLIAADQDKDAARREAFLNALPVAGVDGTLRRRMRKTTAEARVQAKTGSLSNVCTLSGYLQTESGDRLVFSLMMNHYPRGSTSAVRLVQDEILAALTGWKPEVKTTARDERVPD